MRRLESAIVWIFQAGVAISFVLLIVAVLTQVLGRTFGSSPVWTEELTRYAMLYMVAFGAGLSFRSGDLVNVDVLCDALPGAYPWRLRLFSALVSCVLCAFLLPAAWKYVSIGAFQTSPALGVRMDYIHFSVFALLAGLFAFTALRAVTMIFYAGQGLPAGRLEQD